MTRSASASKFNDELSGSTAMRLPHILCVCVYACVRVQMSSCEHVCVVEAARGMPGKHFKAFFSAFLKPMQLLRAK